MVNLSSLAQCLPGTLLQEEALVAFTAPKAVAQRLQLALGAHFRSSRQDVVQPRKVGQKAPVVFSSYIVSRPGWDAVQLETHE